MDTEVLALRESTFSAATDAAALSRALTIHLPSILRDSRALALCASTLQQDLVALESRLFALLLAKAEAQSLAWEASERASAASYATMRAQQLAQAEAQPLLARQLLGLERERIAAAAAAAAAAEQSGTPQQQSAASAAATAFLGGVGNLRKTLLAGTGPRSTNRLPRGSLLPQDFASTGGGSNVSAMAAAINKSLQAPSAAAASFLGGLGAAFSTGSSSSGAARAPGNSISARRADFVPESPSEATPRSPGVLSPAAFAVDPAQSDTATVPYVSVKDMVAKKVTPAATPAAAATSPPKVTTPAPAAVAAVAPVATPKAVAPVAAPSTPTHPAKAPVASPTPIAAPAKAPTPVAAPAPAASPAPVAAPSPVVSPVVAPAAEAPSAAVFPWVVRLPANP